MKELKQQQIVGQYSVWEWCKKKELDYKSSLFLSSCYCCLASQQTKKLSWYVAKASQQQRLYDSQNWDTRDILPQFLESWEILVTNGSEVWKRYHKTYSQWWIIEWNAGRFFTNCMAIFNPIKMNVVGEHFSWERGWGSFTCNIVLKLSRAQVGVNLVILNRGRFIKKFAIWPNWNEIIRGKIHPA